MALNRVQFQSGLFLPQFMELYGTEQKCEAAPEKTCWPDGFRCPRCEGKDYGLIAGLRHKRYQCRSCRHQAAITAGSIQDWHFFSPPDAPSRGELPNSMAGSQQDHDDAGHPLHVKLASVATFSFAAIDGWAQDSLAMDVR